MNLNNISKSHQQFADDLNNPKVLTNPKEFLGPNYKAVIDFWLSIDDLSEELLKVIEGRYWDFYNNQWSEWCKVTNEAIEASNKTIGREFANCAACAAYVVYGNSAAGWATLELIGMHKFFEQKKPLIFFKMFLDL